MKIEVARGLFVVAALAVASVAVAAWEEPGPAIVSHSDNAAQCPLPRLVKPQIDAKPDHDLLLLMYGLSQGGRTQS